jgi:hypothetical protein
MEMKPQLHLNNGPTKITFLVVFLSIFLTLSACDNDKDDNKAEKNQVDNKIILSADGIGPINATTSFNMHQMTLAFSDYNVVEEVNYLDGRPFPAIRVSEGVKTILNIIPDASHKGIYSVIVEDNIIKNSLGHHLGSPYHEIYAYGQNEQCQPGSADMSGKVLCYAPKTPNILYVFNGQWENAIQGIMPPADILQGWSLESIIWRPKT